MYESIYDIIKPPEFQDEEKKRIARILHIILCAISIASILLIIVGFFEGWYYTQYVIFFILCFSITSLILNSYGLIKSAIYLLLSFSLIATFMLLLWGSGIHDAAIVIYPVIIVVASLLLNKRIFIVFTILTVLSIISIAIIESVEIIIPNIQSTSMLTETITIVTIIIIESVAIRLLTDNLLNSVKEARMNEQKYRRIFNNIQDIYFEMNFDGILLEISPSVERLSKYSRSELLNKSVFPIVDTDNEFLKILKEKGELINYEVKLKDKDNSLLNVAINATIDKDIENEQTKIIGSIRDITEYKKLENQLLQTQKMESIGKLAGGISHDFNNLLTVILGYSDIALTKAQDPALKNMIKLTRAASEKAANLTRQLLAFSRKQVFRPVVLNLNIIINNLDKMIQRLIEEDITVVKNLQENIPPIKADPGQVEQIILNLIINARDALSIKEEKSGFKKKITIDTGIIEINKNNSADYFDSYPGNFVFMAIHDNGIGMDKEIQERIFEPFFTTKGEGQGTGLGLSTVYGIVKQNKGFINIKSEKKSGSTFKIFWPVSDESNSITEKTEEKSVNLNGYERIFVVEDDKQVRNFAVSAIQKYNYKVHYAEDGEDALNKFKELNESVDLLITDVIMPNMNGKELVQKIKGINPDIKVLFVSGYNEDLILKSGELEKGINFLQKPYSVSDLLKKMRQILDS